MSFQKITVKPSRTHGGRGVFALSDIRKNEIIEVCPLILIPRKDFEGIRKTKLYFYYFEYSNKEVAISLGYGSLYNHSFEPNARYTYDFKKKVMTFRALESIKKGREIFVNYNYDPDDKTPLPDWYKEDF